MGEQRLNSRFPLQEEKDSFRLSFSFCTVANSISHEAIQAPLPGGGGVTIVRESGLYHKGCLSAPYEHMSLRPLFVAISSA